MENVKKKRKISKKKIALIAVSSVLLCILIAVGVLFGPGLFAKKAPPVEAPSTAKSMRKEAPTDGTLPTEVADPLDNIAYLAYVLDNQPYFKNYAFNSTVAMGYEQITKSWKDYKGAELTGIGKSVMVCSDLTYSLLVKSATQTCFVGGSDAYLRVGNKPGADTLPTEIGWGEDLTRYTHDSYLTAYGEFSTELTVYVINEETVASVGEVKDNGDGTYSQSVSLTPQAACWYQYGMKTRGSLKGFPVFHAINITFTYDAKWQVLESYCEEDATIAPSALGGSPQNSASKTTTTFTYGAEAIDEKHFAYFDDYYKSRLDVSTDGGDVKPAEPDMLEVLGSGFRNVMDASRGQQFSLGLKVGETEYEGKAFAKLGDMGDVLGTLDVRLALGKKGGDKQDFYLEFAGGDINAYYGNNFAMTANLDRVSASVKNLTDKIKELAAGGEKVSVYSLLAAGEDEGGEFDFNAVLDQFGFELSETGAVITIKSDDLLGLGIGVDAVMNFSRTMDETGGIFDFESFSLNSLSLNGEEVALAAALAPDESEPITRDKSATPADLSEYIDGVYNLLDSNTIKVDISLADKLVEGLSFDASAYVKIAENLAARVDVSAEYKGISLKLNAYYEYDENYGKIYINLTELNGRQINAKVYCPVDGLLETVKKLTGGFGNAGGAKENESESLAAVINKVLVLDFAQIIGEVSGDAQKITLNVNADKLLEGLDISAGFEIGEISLELLNDGGTLILNGSLPEFGLGLSVSGSDYALTSPEDKGNYVDILDYVDSVFELLNAEVIEVNLQLSDKLVSGLTAQATAFVAVGEPIAVRVEIEVSYNEISAKLNAYYVYDGGYGKVYINLTELNGQQLDAKIYCDIKDTAEAIQKLIGTQTAVEIQMPEITVSKVVEVILQLDFNKLLKVDNEKLAITVNADEVLNGLGIDLGVSFGEITLGYEKATSELTGEIPALGVKLNVSASEEQVKEPADKENYVDILGYIDSVFELLNAEVIEVNLQLSDKLVSGLTAQATAFVAVGEPIAARVEIEVSYNEISAKLNAYYVYDGGYGKVYINVTELNGQQLNAKIYCDIKDTAEAIQKLIGTQTAAEIQMPEITVSKVVEVILQLDFNKLLKVDNEKLAITVNADEVLNGLGIDLGVSLGEITLGYEKATSELTGEIPALGVTLSVSASEEQVAEPADKENYVDILDYVDNIANLVLGGKYHLGLEFDGAKTEIKDVQAVYAKLNAEVEFKGENKTVFAVQLNDATAKYENITLTFNAYYEIDLKSDTYGKIYINVTEFNGQRLNAKIYCDIKDTAEAIQKLIGTQTAAEIQMPEITVSKVVEVILQLDFNKLLKVDNEKLTVTVDADEVLKGLGIDLGVSFGEITLGYEKATSELTGEIPALGVTLSVSASEEQVAEPADKENYVDILGYIDSVFELLNAEVIEVNLQLSDKLVSGLTAQATAFVAVGEPIAARVDIEVSYNEISAKLNAYYIYDGGYGKVYINVTELNGQQLNAKIYCDIKDTAEAIQKLIGTQTVAEIQMPEITVSKVVEVILQLDFNKLLKVDNEKLTVTVDADEVLNGLGIDLGVSFGEITLGYEKATSNLTGEIPALGVKLNVSASEEQVAEPADKENYVDVNDFIALINSAIEEANRIIDGKDVSFTVNAKYEKDGVSALINGTGEVIWTSGGVKVALSLDVTVLRNGENTQFTFGFVYDQTAYDGENSEIPFAIVTINDTGLKVYRSETDNLAETIGGLIAAIKNLTSGDNAVAPAASGYSAYGARDFEIKDILYNENVNKILSALLEFAGRLTIGFEDIDGDSVRELIINHAAGGSLTIDADGCLALSLKVRDFAVSVSAEAGEGLTVNAILKSFEEGYYFYEDIDSFAKYLLNEVLNSLDGFTLKDVLGTDSYSVDFILDGKESGLKALENVYVKGETYYTENLTDERLGNNLFKTDLHFLINGTAAEASLSYSARNIYVSLTEVGNLKFADLKFKTGADELYSAIEQIVRIITDTNLVKLLGGNAAYSSGENEVQAYVEGENTVLTDVLYAFLNMDLSESFKLDKESGTAEINIDDILEAAAGVKIGTIKIVADKKNRVVSASVTCGDSAWLSLEANPATFDDNDKNKINPDDYIEVGFIATLLSDVKNILTDDNGDIYKLYTYTGTIKANIIVAGDVSLNNVTLTLGFDSEGGLYFTLAARLEKKTFIWDAADIGITYSHGLITLSRNMGTDGEEYKIMTIEYLLDNLFNKQSPIAWLLGMNPSTWSTIMNMAVKDVNVSSGLTTPQTYNLFEMQQVQTDSRINIANYIAGMKVAINGQGVSEYGNAASGALSKFGDMGGNYYAFDIKAKELTGGALTELYAAVTRSDDRGINGIKAYGAVQSFVTFTLDLDTYRESITNTFDGADENYLYAPSSPEFGTVAAPDYYGYVEKTYGFDKEHIFEAEAGSHYTPVFGCFSANKNSTDYIASNVLETVFLDVYDGEDVERTLEIRYGSTVNLVSAFPEFAGDGHKLIYIGANGEKLPASLVIEDGGVLPIIDGRVSVYKSSEEAEAVTFDFSGLIQPVTAALGDEEALNGYDLAGYTFLGWYDNPQFTGDKLEYVSDIVPVDGVKTVYGWYVKTEIMINGVIYTFFADNGGYYAITGFGETEIKPFTAENSVLKLENSFTFGNREYKVTAISEGAFANAMLKNVVVPSNIVTVGKLAFLNNYGIRSVTFLADSVYLQGGTLTGYTAFDTNVTNDAPFYNCGEADGATTTLLNVYYNEITCDGDKNWRHFLRIMTYVPAKANHYFVGSNGGTLNAKGSWAYAEYTLNANNMTLSEFGLSNGVTADTALLDCAALENYIKGILDAKTASEFVNGYAVTVTSSTAEGKTLFVITITQNSVSDRYYKFNLTVADESAANAVIEAEHTVFGEEIFVKCGATVKVLPAIDGFTVNTVSSSQNVSAVENEDIITFVMPDGVVEMRVACSKKTIKEVKIISEKVSFTYDGSKAANEFTVSGVEEGITELSEPQADGYYFLGWTYLDGDNLVFCDSTVTYSVYYPVWGVKRDELEVSGAVAAGGSPNAEASGLNLTVAEGAAFYKWYKDAEFVSEADTLKKTDTLLYSRMKFKLQMNLSANGTEWYYTKYDGNGYTDMGWNWGKVTNGKSIGNNNCMFTADTLVIEGYTVEVFRYWSNAICIQVRNGGDYIVSYLIKGKNTDKFEKWRPFMESTSHYIELDTSYWVVADGVQNSGSKFYKDSNSTTNMSQLFGTVENVNCVVSFTVVA